MSDLYSGGGKFQKGGSGHPGHSGRPPRRKKRTSPAVKILTVVAVLLFSLVAGMAVYGWQLSRSQAEFDRLAAMTQTKPTETGSAQLEQTVGTTGEATTGETQQTESEAPKEVLPQYQELYAQNNEFWGWVSIADSKINYPVMHTPDDPEKYLYANFEGEYNYTGTPFLDANCNYDSDNLIIYSHNMNNGSMFHALLKYDSINYWQNHPVINLNTLYEEREYEVLAAFYDRVYYSYETNFKFYQFIDAADEEEFDNAVATIKDKALYDTGVTAEYGDQLVMLVTCSSHTDNGRFVLVGRYHPES